MKYFLFAISFVVITAYGLFAEAAEMKKVCRIEKVKGKDMEVCKTIKVHKKLEGTKVPTK